MPPTLTPSTEKYAWSLIGRSAPPKRSARERVRDYDEIYTAYDEATVRAQAARCIQCPEPLCRIGCPLANRIPDWMALTAQGRFLEAAEVSRATSNMPEICSRVCPQERLCEGACIVNSKTEPISIGAVERFINEYAFHHGGVPVISAPPNGLRAAIIGSGPGGISCADELARRGFAVTVFESMRIPGGLLVNGIPSFKLEKHVVARRIELLQRNGVVFEMGVQVGRDVSLADLQKRFDAIFLGFGAQQPKLADVPGGDLPGVIPALPFLIQKNVPAAAADFPPIDVAGKRVAVLGGGDTAMDCLRTSLRAGASAAVCIYRRDLANMPGSRKEYHNAVEEGARFDFLTNPLGIFENGAGAVGSVRCTRMELGAPDASGRRKPRPVPGSDFTVDADVVIVAYGFDPVPFPAGSDFAAVATNDWGGIVIDDNQMTSVPGVFAGGDSVRGPSLVVHAVRDGRKAAAGIERYLAGKHAVTS
ncbi:NAD(P)-dependent oxidoreductase [Opitutus sp. ER46]|uniref:NAD(P)-dependent oxidoreductase n=1 Tax=Opitutus sp. ER46 TaxID=2161864 RepID=UPI000D30E7A3|nr:NAD(P)-dependent oxidoreductase [Opitutus sp. ER46]PTY00510.1 dihydropyrimidine dehydrogenase [Opitutus sp. ER46]